MKWHIALRVVARHAVPLLGAALAGLLTGLGLDAQSAEAVRVLLQELFGLLLNNPLLPQ